MPVENINITADIFNLDEPITQSAHGFVVGDVVRCSDATANTYVKAQADVLANAKAVGVVSQVVNVNEFVITYAGRLTSGVPAQAQGTVMYLSDSVAGAMSTTAGTVEVRILEISENALSAIVNIDFSGGGAGGAFVPLAGTGVGSPVTGDIEIQNTGPSTTNIIPQTQGVLIQTDNGTVEKNLVTTDTFAAISAVGSASSAAVVTDSVAEMSITLEVTDTNGTSDIQITDDQIIITGTAGTFPGAEYGSDYSGNYTNRSLVDKEYVDNAAGGTAIVYLTRADLQTLITNSTLDTTVTYAITDAIGSTEVMFVWASSVNTLYTTGVAQTNSYFGIYNIGADTFIQGYVNNVATPATGDMLYYNAVTGLWAKLAAGGLNQPLLGGGTGVAPSWGTAASSVVDGSAAAAVTGFTGVMDANIFTYSYCPRTKVCTVYCRFQGVSNATTMTCTLPFTSAAIDQFSFTGGITNNNVLSDILGRVAILSGTTLATFTRDRSGLSWTAANTKAWLGTFSYFTA